MAARVLQPLLLHIPQATGPGSLQAYGRSLDDAEHREECVPIVMNIIDRD